MDSRVDHGAPVLAAPAPVLAHIFSFVSGRDCAAATSACQAFRAVLDSEPHVWAHCCSVDFGLAPDDVTREAQELQQRGGASHAGPGASTCPADLQGDPHARADQGARPHTGTPSAGVTREGSRGQGGGADAMGAKAVYRKHYLCLRRYGSAYKRALGIWRKLLTWLQANVPALAASILPGVSDAQMDFVERSLGVVLPPALRALYSLHNGQLTAFDAMVGASEDAASTGLRSPVVGAPRGSRSRRGRGAGEGDTREGGGEGGGEEWSVYRSRYHGLLGGYAFYDHAVSTRLLPLQLMVLWTLRIRAYVSRRRPRQYGGEREAEGDEEEEEGEEEEGGEGGQGEGAGQRQALGSRGPGAEWEQRVLIAASFVKVLNGFHFTKMFFLDCSDGMVYVGGSDALAGGALLQCTPPPSHFGPLSFPTTSHSWERGRWGAEAAQLSAGASGGAGVGEGVSADSGLLRWLEEYASRLEGGMYAVRQLQEDGPFRGICLFPETPPLCSQAVTRGVCVRASAIFVPEATPLGPPMPRSPVATQPQLPPSAERGAAEEGQRPALINGAISNPPPPALPAIVFPSCFAYSVRIRLLGPDQAPPTSTLVPASREPPSLAPAQGSEARGFRRCQLRRRHWLIEEEGQQVAEVRGEAVVGKYPLLLEGGEEFVYQSCTQTSAASGAIQGDFTFVPGSLLQPEGPEFEVAVARFPIQMPDYIF